MEIEPEKEIDYVGLFTYHESDALTPKDPIDVNQVKKSKHSSDKSNQKEEKKKNQQTHMEIEHEINEDNDKSLLSSDVRLSQGDF